MTSITTATDVSSIGELSLIAWLGQVDGILFFFPEQVSRIASDPEN